MQTNRETLCHPVAKGDATEDEWLCLLKNHLPYRYQADKAFVIDSEGGQSEQIDIVIYDRQYTPLLFNQNSQIFIPAESVYVIFEVRQELDLGNIKYAGNKIASVRKLKRTSGGIVDIGEDMSARPLTPILGGILTTVSSWNPPFGDSFQDALESQEPVQRLDLGIALAHGSFDISREVEDKPRANIEEGENALLHFFFNLLLRLQRLGTVSAIDYLEYLKVINRLS